MTVAQKDTKANIVRKRLGRILLDQGVITEDQLRIGLREQQTTRKPLGTILIDMGFVTYSLVRDALSVNTGQRSVTRRVRRSRFADRDLERG